VKRRHELSFDNRTTVCGARNKRLCARSNQREHFAAAARLRAIKEKDRGPREAAHMTDVNEILSSRAPRYTSYPTAPHFHAGIGAQLFASWLRDLPQEMPLSLYFHIPFCDTLCWFCGCHTAVINNYRPVADYVDTLLEEMRMVAGHLSAKRRVRHIHWGGGSPTILSASDIARLDAGTRALFDVAPDAEFAIEIDPRGFSRETAQALAQAGVNRASIGVQDCDAKVQAAINRIQSRTETRSVIQMLRGLGIRDINLDLIYGLPHQTAESITRTVVFAQALKPSRLAVFGYAHVPSFKKHQALIAEDVLPRPRERLEQEALIHALLTQGGYQSIGIDHYARLNDPLAIAARNGTMARNFQGYTTDQAPALIGFGASAISALPQGYVQNTVPTAAWRTLVQAGKLTPARGIALTQGDRIRRHIIERLMCDLAVDLAQVRRRFALPQNWFAEEIEKLQTLVQAGLATIDQEKVAVAGPYRQAARLLAAVFDRYLEQGAARHAVTA
jgi:oxygen-independent coproporphyrinogen-3 oxidase